MPCPSYKSKIILDGPNCFGRVQIVLLGSNWFWSGQNYFDQVQVRFFWTNFYDLDLIKMSWTRPKRIGPIQNNWYSTKIVWTVHNHFEPIEGQVFTVQSIFYIL